VALAKIYDLMLNLALKLDYISMIALLLGAEVICRIGIEAITL
jgi:hypothetical protein